mgnify:CR=1 FL=1
MRLLIFILIFPLLAICQEEKVTVKVDAGQQAELTSLLNFLQKSDSVTAYSTRWYTRTRIDSIVTALANFASASHTHSIADITALQTAIDAKQNALGFTAVPNTRTVNGQALSGDITISSVATITTARKINGVDFNGSADIYTDVDLLAYAALGSAILAETVQQKLAFSNTSTAMVDGQIKYTAVYLPKATTLTGIKVYVRAQGSYTGDNNNRVGLYSYSGGTLTLVASSANNSTLWTSAANSVQTIPFSSTYAANAGLYFVAFIYNQSAQTTAPSLASGTALNNAAMSGTAFGFTNSAKLHGTSSGTDLPASIAMSSITASTIPSWTALY